MRQPPAQGTKPAPSIISGNFKVMHRPGFAFEQARRRLMQQGFQLQETSHFLLARAPASQVVTLVHRFTPQEIDNNLGDYLLQELEPMGLMASDQAFGSALLGVVHSVTPHDPVGAWNLFSMNTLHRLREQLDDTSSQADRQDTITASASVYRRLFSLKVGTSLLDVGCACAFWPILVAEREQDKGGRVVGVDSRRDAINLSKNLAALTTTNHLEFLQVDVLAPDFPQLGPFDMVTSIHMLEHLPESRLSQAFEHLLRVTRHRLIIAVPYEEQATAAYGHEQVFTHEKLEKWGRWCVERVGNPAQYWCEEVGSGLLIVDRLKTLI